MTTFSEQYRVYILDNPGQPGRGTPDHPLHGGQSFGQWLVDVLDGLGSEDRYIAG
ncbi:MAG: hypothetical protein JXB30_10785 [Anaerolineae bacterium]|nr:hypothetical protein [Anaerolineae bacterium]